MMHDSKLEEQDMNKIRLIHVRTLDQYNSWVKKLEDEGYVWNGDAPINIDEIDEPDTKFVIELEIDDKTLSYGCRGYYTKDHGQSIWEIGRRLNHAKENDPVNNPSHYNQGPIETIEIIQASMSTEMFKGYLLGNVLKYMLRAPYKDNQEQDHKKAKWYFDKLRSVSNENK